MRDEGDMDYISHEPIREYRPLTSFGIAWRILLGVAVVYGLLTAVLVLTHG